MLLLYSSNSKGQTKLTPVCVCYFNQNCANVKLLYCNKLPGEISDLIMVEPHLKCTKIFCFHLLKLVGRWSDNTNTNFGGVERNGQGNILQKLQVFYDKYDCSVCIYSTQYCPHRL